MTADGAPVLSMMLAVPDAAAAARWYGSALGATILWDLGSVVGLDLAGAPFFLGEPQGNRWDTPETLGSRTVRVEVFVDDPDAFVARAVAAGADGTFDQVRDHEMPWGPHRQGSFVDPFGHLWLVGDRSPLRAHVMPTPATPADVDAIHALRRSLEDWMAENGTVQWPQGSLPRERIAAQVDAGEWHLVRDGSGLVGTVRLLWSDPDFWGADDTPAVYVHGLMVDRRHAGRGTGRALLDWAAARGRDAGVGLFRLDCRTTNPTVRAYYEAYGFTAVGQRDFADFSCTLLELALPGRPSG